MKKLEYKSTLIDSYFQLLKNLSDSAKGHLIDLLSKSLKKKDKGPRKDFELFGAWESSESADEIIQGLRNDRHFTREIENM